MFDIIIHLCNLTNSQLMDMGPVSNECSQKTGLGRLFTPMYQCFNWHKRMSRIEAFHLDGKTQSKHPHCFIFRPWKRSKMESVLLIQCTINWQNGVLIILTSVHVPPVIYKQIGLENREIHQIQDVHAILM